MRKDKILIVDLEMTCWDDDRVFDQEIIEIGIAEIDTKTLTVGRQDSFLCRPRGEISDYCVSLTGHSREQLLRSPWFEQQINTIIKRYGPASKMSYAWGNDKSILNIECHRRNIRNPFYNMDNLAFFFGLIWGDPKRGLMNALADLGLTPIGRHHCGVDDAVNTARLMIEMIKKFQSVR
ncbi:MAG: 3'-5' exonuclease [Candidimonas sp.]